MAGVARLLGQRVREVVGIDIDASGWREEPGLTVAVPSGEEPSFADLQHFVEEALQRFPLFRRLLSYSFAIA